MPPTRPDGTTTDTSAADSADDTGADNGDGRPRHSTNAATVAQCEGARCMPIKATRNCRSGVCRDDAPDDPTN